MKTFENRKISVKQLQTIIVLWTLAFSLSAVPYFIKNIYSVIIGAVFSVLICIFTAFAAEKIQKNNNTVLKTISKKLSSVNAFMYTVFLVRLVCSAVNIYLLPSAPVWILALLFVIAAMYCVFLGIQTIGRSAEIIFIFVLVSMVTAVIFCTTDFAEGLKTKNIFDLNKSYADMRTVFLFGSPVILYNLISYTDGTKRASSAVKAYAIGLIVSVLLIVFSIAEFGRFNEKIFPVISLTSTVNMPHIFGDKENVLMLRIWFLSAFASTATGIYISSEIILAERKYILVFSVLVIIAASFLKNVSFVFDMPYFVGIISVVFAGIIIPVLSLITKDGAKK
ncbi:MAG: hypothetical protein EGQ35_04105 [Clostridiales bacterium]|nr:hypothetical protein [Clostridiales bacterium]